MCQGRVVNGGGLAGIGQIRRQEEDDFRLRPAPEAVLEQFAQQRKFGQQGNLLELPLLLFTDKTADGQGFPVFIRTVVSAVRLLMR